MEQYSHMQELVKYLNDCTKKYDEGSPIISDKEWDDKYFELQKLEEDTGLVLGDSPTQTISYTVLNSLTKVTHNHKMLSLDKTKSIDDVEHFLGTNPYVAMCKMDGLTCTLTYLDGILVGAETRGNGIVGEDVFNNIKTFSSVPKKIPCEGLVIIDGEIICTYEDFKPFIDMYKNPRNFAAGSIRLLDSKECAKRKLTFVAWDVIKGFDDKFLHNNLSHLIDFGFKVVPYCINYSIEDSIDMIKEYAENEKYPIDGVVFKFDDIAYGKSLGETAHHFKNAIAYKFYDEIYSTKLQKIDWTMGRTGTLTPVAVFDPIEIEGSIIERASLHNISIMEEILGIPYSCQKLEVYKSNMIIPQIYSAEKKVLSSEQLKMPEYFGFFPVITECPICGYPTEVYENNGVKILKCTNLDCEGKLINRLDHFCGKKGLDIKGLSKATLGKLIDWGWITDIEDLFNLDKYSIEWKQKSGFGEKSVDNILTAIKNSSNCNLANFIASIGIPLIGTTASKELVKYFPTWDSFIEAVENGYHFYDLPNFGIEMNNAIVNFNYTKAKQIANKYLTFEEVKENAETSLDGITFVITGKLTHFKNRDEIKAKIENAGGKVTSSVSKNTKYLINNDKNSTSAKNKSAKALNIPIISEEDFIKTFGID